MDTAALPDQAGSLAKPGESAYDAFISYSHAADGRLAPALQRELERFGKRLFQRRALHIFRDETNLSASPELWTSIVGHLNCARWLLLMASPTASTSKWIKREIQWWLEHRSAENILLLITDGDVVWDEGANDFNWDATTAIPRALSGACKNEPLWVDLRWAHAGSGFTRQDPQFRAAILQVGAPLHGVAPDELDSTAIRAQRVFRTFVGLAFAVAICLALVAGYFAIAERRQRLVAEEQRNDAMSRALAAQALHSVKADPTLGFWLAKAALEKKPTLEAQIALFSVFDSESCFYERAFENHFALVADASFSPDGRIIVTASDDMTARLWDTETGKELRQLQQVEFKRAAFSRDGTRVVTLAKRDNTEALVVWDATTGQKLRKWDMDEINEQVEEEIHQLTGHSPSNWGSVDELSPDKTVRLEVKDNTVILRDAKSTDQICQLVGHGDHVSAARFSPDGSSISTASGDRTVRLWRVPARLQQPSRSSLEKALPMTTNKRFKYEGKDGELISVSDTVKKIKAQAQGMEIQLLDLSSGKILHSLVGHTGTVTKMMFSPDGTLLATACDYGLSAGEFDVTLRTWDVATGREIHRYTGVVGIHEFRFSADGATLFMTYGFHQESEYWSWPVTWQEVLRTILEDKVRGVPRALTAKQREGYGIE